MRRSGLRLLRATVGCSCQQPCQRLSGWLLGAVVLFAVASTGCGSSPLQSPELPRPRPKPPSASASASLDPSTPERSSPAEKSTREIAPVESLGVEPSWSGRLLDTARSLVGVPYRYAGDDVRGFDCSGFVSFVFRRFGFALPRTADEQARYGDWVALDEAGPGDLLFFGSNRSALHHVGIVVSQPGEPLTMIHASTTRGVIETVVEHSRYWLGRLRGARRVERE